jgi:outer membrane protein assembly factor BamB
MRFVIAATRIVPAALLMVLGTPALAAPVVAFAPAVGHPQGAVRVSGSGFAVNEAVDIFFDTTDAVLDVTDAAGKFGIDKIVIPANALPGDHWVTAIGRKNGDAAHRKLVVSTAWASHGFNERGRRRNPYENVINTVTVGRLDVAWSAATGNSITSSPAVSQVGAAYNPFIFVGSFDNSFDAFDSTGALKWSKPMPDQIDSSPAVADGVVYVGCQDTNLYAFKTASGAAAWPSPAATGGSIDSSPAVANGIVYVGSQDGKLYAFKTGDGSAAWASPAVTGGNRFSSPAVSQGNVYIGSGDNKLYAFKTADGTAAWTAPAMTGGSIDSSPAVANGVVYVGSNDFKLYAFNAKSGAAAWAAPVTTGAGIVSSPAVANNVVYVGSNDGKLYAVNASTGATLWTGSTGTAAGLSSPAVASGVVYIGTNGGGKIFAFNANGCGVATCSPLWVGATGGAATTSPSIADGLMFVGSTDHSLYAFALDAGNAAAYAQRHAAAPSYSSLHPDFRLKPVKRTIGLR